MSFNAFGKKPANGFTQSPNYKHGAFQNLSETDMSLKGTSMFTLIGKFLNKPKNTVPPKSLPSVKTDLTKTGWDKPVITWFGHSSYLIQYKNKNILVDPVFSGYASPVPITGKAFAGADIYTVDDMPYIDILIITHDHYDHLDHKTVKKLVSKTKHIYTSLGVGTHLQHWGINEKLITELDWHQSITLEDGIELTAAPARHFSGRGIKRNKSLWSSFVLKLFGYNIFIGSDSGYDTHFAAIGSQYGPFDIAFLENGQYNELWPNIHMFPEQTVQAAIDLKAKVLMPVHWGKFSLALHPWDEPIQRVTKAAKEADLPITTPMIGEPVVLNISYPQNIWWNL